jgi:Fe-Mn family superoxide dismutase
LNNQFFWESLSPKSKRGGRLPRNKQSSFYKYIDYSFLGFENMVKDFQKYSGAYRGSGWAWLAYDITKDLVVFTITDNNDSLLDDEFEKMEPLLCIDLWEHAYYQTY